jgi:Site-specific recombinase XerD
MSNNPAPRRLTEGYIRSLRYEGRPYTVRDTSVTGLLVQVNQGSKSYKVQRDLYQGERGRRRLVKTFRRTLSTTDEITLDDARTRAQELIALVKRGIDPNAKPKDPKAAPDAWTVERMYQEYVADLKARDCAERTINDVLDGLDRYLKDWKSLPITDIKRSVAREKHKHLTTKHGKRVANQALKIFRAAYNLALKIADDPDTLPDNPVKAVTFNKERASNRVILPEDLPDWWRRVQALPNPLRRDMHTLGLLSGLRPGTLVSLRREWVRLDEKAIVIPRMKSGRSFALPLSDYMVELVRRIMATGDMLFPGAPWLFPSRSKHTREVIATKVWKEDRTLPSETGHILRHTYRTVAQRAGIDRIDARLLLDHAVPGIDGVYIHEKALFDRLLAQQETMTSHILALCVPNKAEGGCDLAA